MSAPQGPQVLNRAALQHLAMLSFVCSLLGVMVWFLTHSLPMAIGVGTAVWTALGVAKLAQPAGQSPTASNPTEPPKT